MEVLEHNKINKLNNFIYGQYIDKNLCDELVNYYENSSNKKSGTIYSKNKLSYMPEIKRSTDLSIELYNSDNLIMNYYDELGKVLDQYKEKYIYCSQDKGRWAIHEAWNIQKYKPNEGFFAPHSERGSISTIYRHLVFMTYLNDVTDGGETEFFYQKLKVKPEKGLTLIWPTDWTFTHNGITSPTQTKYITTGWYSFTPKGLLDERTNEE